MRARENATSRVRHLWISMFATVAPLRQSTERSDRSMRLAPHGGYRQNDLAFQALVEAGGP